MGDEEKLKILIEAQNKAQAAFTEAQKQIGDTEKKFVSATEKMDAAGEKMKAVGGKMTKYMTLPILAGAGLSIKAFSDLQETLNKVDVSFGKSSGAVKKWSETSIEKMGLAQQTALDTAALFGDMGTGMGQNQKDAAKMSMGLTQLAADLSSFKNVSVETAKNALAGIYTGEGEALKGLGVIMTETNLNAYAVSSGFIKVSKDSTKVRDAAMKQQEAQEKLNEAQKKYGKSSTEAAKAQIGLEKANEAFDKSMQGNTQSLTDAEKIQLRYNYVMDKTKNAQGDYANTSDSLANKQRAAQEKVKQLSAQLGGKLAPAYMKLLQVGSKVLDWFGKLSDGQQDLIVKAALVAAAIGPVVRVMGSLTKAITGTYKAGKQAVKTTKDLAGWVAKHGKATASTVKFQAQYRAMQIKENALKAAAKVKTVALTVAEKARMVATKIATAAQAAFNAVMSANPVFLVVAAVVALVAVMVILYKKNKTVRDFIDKSWKAISAVFVSVWNVIKGAVLAVFNWIKNNWQLIVGIIAGPIGLIILAFTKYRDQTMKVFKAVWEIIKWAWNGIVAVIKWAWENVIKPIWTLLVGYVTNILIPGYKLLWSVIQTVWNAIVAVIQWAWNNVIKPIWDILYAYVVNVLIPTWKMIWSAVQTVWNGVTAVITWAWNNVIKPIWDILYAYVTTVLIPTWQKIWEVAQTVWNNVVAGVQAAWDFIKPIWDAIWNYITNTLVPIFQKIWDKVSSVFTSVWNKIVEVKNNIVNAFNTVKSAIQGIIDKFTSVKDKVSSAFSGVKDAISKPFQSAMDLVKKAWNSTLGGKGFSIPDIPGIPGRGKKFEFPKLYKGIRGWQGGAAVVGDVRGQGGEIVHMPTGTDVYNNRESKRIMRALADGQVTTQSSDGRTIIIHKIEIHTAEAAEAFWDELNRDGELQSMGAA